MTRRTKTLQRRARPVFLVGCHRSGTTLARFILDAHPTFACPPESKFIAGLRAFMEYPQLHVAFRSLGVSSGQVYEGLRTFTTSVLDQYARSRGKSRWIDKTPNYYRCLDFIDELFDGHVMYLFMTRHPFDTVASLEGWGRGAYGQDDPEIRRHVEAHGSGRLSWTTYWTDVNHHLITFASGHADSCHFFKYEDLVLDTDVTLTRILAFLGETLPPSLVEEAFKAMPRSGRGFGDSSIRTTTRIETSGVGLARSWTRGERHALWRVAGGVAKILGYSSKLRLAE